MNICDLKNCTGCFACMNICPAGAVSVLLDDSFKTVPQIDKDKCISCGLCQKICPEINPVKGHSPKLCFAAWTKDDRDRQECSSGGIAAGFSEYMLSVGGVVFGAGYGENAEIKHICADSAEKLNQLKGSKYVQSDIGFSYRKAKEYLEQDTPVLFTGTPCQIAGLYAYLQKDYDKLVTVELICHGTPAQKFLTDYLDEIGAAKNRTKVTFRGKHDFQLTVFDHDKIIYQKPRETDLYYQAFYQRLSLRNNCFLCRYANKENRPADIIIGDFWGLDRETLKNKYPGKISAVLINTDKGLAFWKKNDFIYEPRNVEEAIRGNSALSHPHPYPKEWKDFLNFYRELGFSRAVKKTSAAGLIKKNKYIMRKNKIKQVIKGLLGR